MKRVPIRALLFGLSLFAALPADAAPECLKNDNPCQPDKLCSFKAALAEKVLLYQLYLRNSQVTKRRGSREGVRYDGDLYDTSMSEAQTAFPKETAAQQRVRAGQIFQEKIRKYASDHFKLPACKTGSVDLSLFPKKGYSGMNTNEACQVWVNFEGGEYDPATDSVRVSDFKLSRLQGEALTQLMKTSLNLKVGQMTIMSAARDPQSARALMIVFTAKR